MLPGHSLVVVLGAMAALGYSCGSEGQGGLQVWDAIPAICPPSYTAVLLIRHIVLDHSSR